MYDFDLIVIGSGAGGSVGAHQAASMGKKVAVFEKGDVGGECPNWACVPTKAILTAAEAYETAKLSGKFGIKTGELSFDYSKIRDWKNLVVSRTGAAHGEKAFKETGVVLVKEKAKFVSAHEVEAVGKTYSAENILIATGSDVFIPPIAGLQETGFITFRQAVDFDHLPKSIFILGGGPIGCEFAQIFSTFGSTVYLADTLPALLAREEKEIGQLLQALFEHRGIKVIVGAQVTKIAKGAGDKSITYTVNGRESSVEAEEILVATGKAPVVDIEMEKAGVEYDKKMIHVNELLQTTTPNVYAAGDVVGPYLFTHTGNYQSYIAVNNMFSENKIKPDYSVVPRCVFADPEVAAVGITEEMANQKGIRIKKAAVPISMLGRANTTDKFDGFVKVITDENEVILGAAIVAPSAGEMIHELALAMKLKAKASDVAEMIHAYPTFSEAIKIACANVE
jgi:pyruvate/2-oxoglutarate dehydrogenase complex dihydrolipoamide dehydrogenase (E3) component